MRISTKGRYGLRAMLDIAVNSAGEHVSLNNIAERQGISENYLEQVFSTLRKAKLVRSIKGAQGGYVLSEAPSNITVGQVLRALEGELTVIHDGTGDEPDKNSIEYCLKVNIWDKLDRKINSLVDSITLEDLANDYRKLNGNMSLMYYI